MQYFTQEYIWRYSSHIYLRFSKLLNINKHIQFIITPHMQHIFSKQNTQINRQKYYLFSSKRLYFSYKRIFSPFSQIYIHGSLAPGSLGGFTHSFFCRVVIMRNCINIFHCLLNINFPSSFYPHPSKNYKDDDA